MKSITKTFLLLFCFCLSSFSFIAQAQTISGNVTDEDGVPLPGATVLVEGTSTGVSTDFDGNYTIEAAAGQTLIFSYVGYSSQNITVGNASTINVQLKADNALDEVVGSRNVPGQYPLAPKSQFLINQGNGDFKLNNSALPNENQLGMITDVLWMDIDSDKDDDLIIVGDWMPITILQNTNHSFIKANFEGLEDSFGLWNCIEKGDVDNDGDEDFIVGNLGLNSQLKANVTKPMTVFYGDFDNNGAIDPILCKYYDDKNYPFFSKDDLQSQLSNLKSAFVSYAAYADQTIYDILKKMDIKKIDSLQVKTLASSIVENLGNMTFQINPLPKEAQLAPVFGIKIKDINQDHFPDLILGGNLMGTRVKLGQLNASRGICLLGNGKGDFRSLNISESGLNIKGEIRAIEAFNDLENNTYYIFALNNAAARVFKLNENSNPPK